MRPSIPVTTLRIAAFFALFVTAASPTAAWGVTPESPEVIAIINRALAYLEKAAPDSRLGGECLEGLCMIKNGKGAAHPSVVAALNQCTQLAKSADSQDNYSTGLAIIFLCELDAERHEQLIQVYLNSLLKRQQRGGGWGYPNSSQGDTSQVQYATLGLWTADAYGIQVPTEVVERLCSFLMRTQDPTGGWGYQTTDPGSYNRVNQSEVRHSLTAAGLGSLYICGDMLGLSASANAKPDTGLPPALRVVENKAAAKKKSKTKVIDDDLWQRFVESGNAWFDKNFKVRTETYNHYYLYAFERYASYRELAEGRVEREPEWYQQVYDHLAKTQRADGSWQGQDTDPIATTFAVLFLCRSSKKTIQKIKDLGEGTLLGGMGLPSTTADLQEKDGRVVESKLAGSVDELLAIIDDPENPQISRLAAGGALSLDGDVTKRAGQIARLRALVSSGSFESRLIAVKALSKSRDLDNVPVLLYALTDPIDPQRPDYRIVREADKGLRFISRKFAGVGLPEEPTPPQVKEARKAWTQWYLSIRPDAELID
jgi:hypothetical protein